MAAQTQIKTSEQANFHHFVMDIAWFGLAAAATSRFLSVYAIRLGATPADFGWISSLPALILLGSASASAWWRRRYGDPVRAMFLPGLLMRFLFLLPALAPFLPVRWQPLWLILSVAIPAIPQGVANVAFTVVLRESINPERMTSLLSRRQLALNITVGVGALAFGLWLEKAPFPLNYQVMFVLAFVFALASLWHCMRIRVDEPCELPQVATSAPKQTTNPWRSRGFLARRLRRCCDPFRLLRHHPGDAALFGQPDGRERGLHGVVRHGRADCRGACLDDRAARRAQDRHAPDDRGGDGRHGDSALIIVLAPTLQLTLFAAVFSGGGWTAAAGVGLFTFFVENTPADEVTTYSVAYNQVIGLAVFLGPMLGSLLASGGINLMVVMGLGAVLRLIAGPLVDSSLLTRGRVIRRDPQRHNSID